MKYYIVVESKTGNIKHLGLTYDTEQEAREDAERTICTNCNTIHIWPIGDNYYYAGRDRGFVDPKYAGEKPKKT